MAGLKELSDELKTVLAGKTLDAIFPPFIFVTVNNFFSLQSAALAAISLALLTGIFRFIRKQKWIYALGGLAGTILAASLALYTSNVTNFFLPAIAGSALLTIISAASLVSDKPMAAWASHLTRGWPLDWFWRNDVKPAYREVTWLWQFYFTVRLFIQLLSYRSASPQGLAWVNTLIGWPLLIIVLIITYIYGTWRLRKLDGPGVDEYTTGKQPPWQGQTRGF